MNCVLVYWTTEYDIKDNTLVTTYILLPRFKPIIIQHNYPNEYTSD